MLDKATKTIETLADLAAAIARLREESGGIFGDPNPDHKHPTKEEQGK